jgi:hypothetical protein
MKIENRVKECFISVLKSYFVDLEAVRMQETFF